MNTGAAVCTNNVTFFCTRCGPYTCIQAQSSTPGAAAAPAASAAEAQAPAAPPAAESAANGVPTPGNAKAGDGSSNATVMDGRDTVKGGAVSDGDKQGEDSKAEGESQGLLLQPQLQPQQEEVAGLYDGCEDPMEAEQSSAGEGQAAGQTAGQLDRQGVGQVATPPPAQPMPAASGGDPASVAAGKVKEEQSHKASPEQARPPSHAPPPTLPTRTFLGKRPGLQLGLGELVTFDGVMCKL